MLVGWLMLYLPRVIDGLLWLVLNRAQPVKYNKVLVREYVVVEHICRVLVRFAAAAKEEAAKQDQVNNKTLRRCGRPSFIRARLYRKELHRGVRVRVGPCHGFS